MYKFFRESYDKCSANIKRSDLHKRVLRGASWSFIGAVVNRLSLLIVSVCLARILGKYIYGQYGIIKSTINMFTVFSCFAMGTTSTKYVAEFRLSDPNKVGRILGLSLLFVFFIGLVIFIACFFSSESIAVGSLNDSSLILPLKIAAVMIMLSAFNGALTGALNGFEAFADVAKVNTISGLFSILSMTLLTYLYGLYGALYGFLLYLLSIMLLSFSFLRRRMARNKICFDFRNCWKELTVIWKFSLPATLNGLVVAPIIWLSNTFVVKDARGYEEMAVYAVSNQWRMLVLFIPGVVSQIALPILSNLHGGNRSVDFRKMIKFNLLFNTSIALLFALGLSCFSRFILNFYGESFADSSAVMVVLLLSAVVSVINSVVGQVILSKGFAWTGLLFNSLWSLSFIGSVYVLVSRYGMGALGLAISYLLSYLLHTIWQACFMVKVLKGSS